MNFSRYIYTALIAALLMLGIVAWANWYIDPYGYWGRMPFGIYQDGTFRPLKARTLSHGKYPAILFGASTTIGTNPDAVPECRLYNAAFNGQRATEIIYLMENFITSEVKTIIIAFDFFFFNQSTEGEYINPDFGKLSLFQILSYTLSTSAIRQSYYTIREWRRIKVGTRKVGSALNPNGQREAQSIIEADAALTAQNFTKEIAWFHQGFLRDYKFSTRQEQALHKIKNYASQKNIRLVIFINPLSEFMFNYLHEQRMSSDLARFRAAVLKTFPEAIDLSESEFSANSGFLKNDPVHFHPDTGAKVLKQVVKQSKACP